MSRKLALAWPEVFPVPAALPFKTGKAHWEVLLRARAIENTAYVVGSATIRRPGANDAFETWGHAIAVDPWGRVLTDLGTAELAFKTVELDMELLREVRNNLPVLRGMRDEAYRTEPRLIVADSASIPQGAAVKL